MKKFAWFIVACFLSLHAVGQIKLGFKISPGFAFNSIVSKDEVYDGLSPNGIGLRFSAGPVADYFFADNYAFHTGLWYTVKRASIEGNVGTTTYNSVYNLQYIQAPIALKFFTNEVSTDLKLYFLLGGTIDIKVAEKPKDKADNTFYKNAADKRVFRPADISLLLGGGGELVMGTNTALFFGLSYNRGLINSLASGSQLDKEVKLRNSLLSLDFGVKF